MIETQVNRHQRRVFKALLLITAFGGLIFFILNVSRGLVVLAGLELLTGLVSILLFFKTYRKLSLAQFRQLTFVYLLIFYAIMFFALSREGVSSNIFIWILVIPLVSYLLLGLKRGFAMTLGFMVLFVLLFGLYFELPQPMQTVVATSNLVFCVLLVWGLSHAYEKATESSHKKLRKLAITDHLTGLYNRSLLKAQFEAASEMSQDSGKSIAVVVLDLDFFKGINDKYGHDAGDWVLKTCAKIIHRKVSSEIQAFRIGGEEFCLICANTSLEQAVTIAENIRADVEVTTVDMDGEQVHVTVSCGVAAGEGNLQTFKNLHALADKRLYAAKNSGRNKVVSQC